MTATGTGSSVTGGLGWCPPIRFLLAGSQLHKAGKQQAVPRARTKLGIFHKLLVCYFKKATQEQLPHVDVLCRTLVITVDVLLPLRLLQNSITRKLELETSGHCKYKHRGYTQSCPQQEQGVCFYPELDIAKKEDLDSVHILGAGNGCLKDRIALSPRHYV